MSVLKDLANHLTDLVLLYIGASYKSSGSFITIWVVLTTTLPREIAPKKIHNPIKKIFLPVF